MAGLEEAKYVVMTLFKLEKRGSTENKAGRFNWKNVGSWSKSSSNLIQF